MTELVRDVSRAEVIQAKTIMRGPNVVVYERQGPRAALHAMESHGLDAVFLIARDFTLRGILTREQARGRLWSAEGVSGAHRRHAGDDHGPGLLQ